MSHINEYKLDLLFKTTITTSEKHTAMLYIDAFTNYGCGNHIKSNNESEATLGFSLSAQQDGAQPKLASTDGKHCIIHH